MLRKNENFKPEENQMFPVFPIRVLPGFLPQTFQIRKRSIGSFQS